MRFVYTGLFVCFAAVGLGTAEEVSAQSAAETTAVEPAPKSFASTLIERTRTNVGFSVGVSGFYGSAFELAPGVSAPTPGPAPLDDRPEVMTSLDPAVFASIKKQQSQLWLHYQFGFRRYSRNNLSNSSSHALALDFSKRVTPRLSWQVTNSFVSAYNDNGTLLSSPIASLEPTFSQDVDVPRQRVSRNSVAANVMYRMGTRGQLEAFGGHEYSRYGALEDANNQGLQVGLRGQYQVNRWLFLNNSFTSYLNRDNASRSAAIQRLQVGNLKFQLGRRNDIEISMGGGLENARNDGKSDTGLSGQAGISKKSESTLLSLVYHRGFSLATGAGSVIAGNNLNLAYTQWLSRRVNLNLSAGYTDGKSLADAPTSYFSGGAELGIAVHSHVVVSTSYRYVTQDLPSTTVGTRSLNRQTAGITLQYFLNSLTER